MGEVPATAPAGRPYRWHRLLLPLAHELLWEWIRHLRLSEGGLSVFVDVFINLNILDKHIADAKQHVRGEPGHLRPGDDDDPGGAGDPERVHAALLDVGQALVRHLCLHRGGHRHLFHPQHGCHWL